MRLVIEWVLLPATDASREGRTRFVAFAAPHLEVDGSESAEQTLASFPAMANWPATLAGASFSVAVDGADPVAAEVVSTPDPALWHQMFPATTRVEGFVREHPEELQLATFDAITIVDGILDGYSELAVIEPVLEDPWDELFWQPEVWGIPEPVPEVMDWIVSPVLPALVEEEHIEVIVTGEVDEVAVGPAPEEESVLVPPSIVDHFQMIVPAVQQQLDESVLWSTNDEAAFVAANSELFLEPEMFETTEGAPTFEELEASTQWHGEPVIDTEDEGLIHVTMVSRPSAVGAPDGAVVGISDAIASWDGWSLAAPRPGKAVASDPVVSDPEHRARTGATMAVEVENTALTSCGLSIHTVATPGTLPRLRFGRSYRMRMRSVDLAGQSVGLDAADGLTGAGTVTDPVVFRRFEPVPPPEITWVSTFPPEDPCGETERRIVVRSGLDPDEQVLGEQPWSSERLLLPPACAVTMAEWHGLFDSAIGRGADAAARRAAYEHAATESGSVRPGVDTTPYLADPASGGVTLWDLPGLPAGEVMTVPWHLDVDGRPQPLVLRLEGIEAGQIRMPEVDPSERFITVFLPAGQRAAIRAASIVATPDVMALPHLWDTRGSQAEDAGALLAAGRHPQVSPSITIEAVHAVPRPLSVPVAAPGEPVGPRAEGDSGVQITRPWRVDTATTASVTLRADWTRPRDDLAAPARTVPVRPTDPQFVPFTESFSAPVGGVARVPLGADPATVVVIGAVDDPAVPARLDLGFTGHVPLRIRAHATSRFTDFFPASFREPRGDLPDHFTVASEWEQIAVRNTERPPPPVVTGVLPLLVHRHDGDTRVREGGWVRVWFARPWFVTGAGEWPAIIAVGDGQPWDNRDPRYKYASLIGADLARVEFPETNETPDPHTAASIYGGWPAAWMVFNSVHLAGVEPAERFDPSALHLCDRGFDYDPTRDEWFMDVQVDTPHVAYPFLRLALVRDQPASIDDVAGFSGIRASEVVTPDPITLLPRREMTCTEGVSGVTVSMTGLIAPQFADVDGRAAWGHSVTVTLQRRRGDGDPLLSWEDLRGAQLPLDSPPGAGLRTGFTFRGSLTLPYDPTSPPGEFRLLVVERDRTARVVGDYPSDGTAERMVHAETFPISRAVVP